MVLERLLLLFIVLCVACLAGLAWRCYSLHCLRKLARTDAPSSVRNLIDPCTPAILYFTSASCAQCRFQQAPILDRIAQRARIAVYTIDAVAQQDLARFYGVMTVPSTVVLNPNLQPIAVNHGLASWEQLDGQLDSMSG